MWGKICVYKKNVVPLQRQIKITPKQYEPHRLRGELYAAGCAAGLATFGVSPAAFCINAKLNKTMNTQTTPAPAFVVSAAIERAAAAYKAAAECAETLYGLFAQDVAEEMPNTPEDKQKELILLRLNLCGIDTAKERLFSDLCAEIRLNLETK